MYFLSQNRGSLKNFHYFCRLILRAKDMEQINRIKVVLAEKQKTNRWLAEQVGKDSTTVSKWCTNSSQPSIEMFVKIARCLEVDLKDLLCDNFK